MDLQEKVMDRPEDEMKNQFDKELRIRIVKKKERFWEDEINFIRNLFNC